MDYGARETRRIGVIDVAVLDRAAALSTIKAHLARREPLSVGFCNAHTANMARADTAFAAALDGMLVLNDGIGVDLASRILYGSAFPDNLNGTDLTWQVLENEPLARRIFLLGSAPGVAERAAAAIATRCPQHRVVGVQHGFFPHAEDGDVAARIRALSPDLLLIGMGHPHQERFAAAFGADAATITMCIGAWIDFTAGVVNRAPQLVRTMRAEWAYRLMLEPHRLARRYLLGNGAFLLATVRQRRKQKGATG